MKKFSVTLAMVLTLGVFSNVFASEALSKEEIEAEPVVTISSAVLTKYVDEENGARYGNGAVLQSAIEISLPKGFYVEVWNSTSLTKNNDSRENDLTLGWAGEVGPVEIEIGGTYIDIDMVAKADESDLWQIFGIAKKEFQISENQKLTPFVKGQIFLPVKGSSIDKKGFHVITGIEHGMPLSEIVDFSNKLSFTYDDGAVGYQQAGLVAFASEVKVKVIKHAALVINGRIIAPMTKVSDGRQAEVVGGVGVALSF
jgi:hypothetical protein